MSRTLGQKRAEYCLKELETLDCNRDEFKKLSAGLPAMILQNGFGQTLAFLLAKGSETKNGKIQFKRNDKHYAAFTIITGWLADRNLIEPGDRPGILRQISGMPQEKYLRAQRETMAMLEWLKRYANAALFEGQS